MKNKDTQTCEKKGYVIWVLNHPLRGVLHVSTVIEPAHGLQNENWKVKLIAVGEPETFYEHEVEVQSLPMPKVYLMGQILFHFNVVRQLIGEWDDLDIILFHQMSAPWLLPLKFWRKVKRGKGPKIVMDVRDVNVIESGLRNRLRIYFFDFIQWAVNRWADGQTVITERMVQYVNVPRKKLWGLWPSGVVFERFSVAGNGRVWPQTDTDPVHLMYVGKLHAERNPFLLCQAVKQANSEGMSFKLSLVGNGPELSRLQVFAEEANDQIEIVPAIPYEDVPDKLREAHVGVTSLPPASDMKYGASSPIKLFEYMAAGLPLLSTRNVCHTDVVRERPFAFWADDASIDDLLKALREIWQQRFSLNQLGEMAVEAVNEYTWAEAAKKLSRSLETGLQLTKVN